jgi:hypothetical protein
VENSSIWSRLSDGMTTVKKREVKVMMMKGCLIAPNVCPVSEICGENLEV